MPISNAETRRIKCAEWRKRNREHLQQYERARYLARREARLKQAEEHKRKVEEMRKRDEALLDQAKARESARKQRAHDELERRERLRREIQQIRWRA